MSALVFNFGKKAAGADLVVFYFAAGRRGGGLQL
jgi:hypothetical protein